jgi:hypothetical protein
MSWISTTAETLIPHEKLRGAAPADATLNAQKRSPAEFIVGYTRFSWLSSPFPVSAWSSRL